MKVLEISEEYGWAELQGDDGALFAIAKESPESPIKAGENAVPTFTILNLASKRKELAEKGAKLVGEIQEIPGHVKFQLVEDESGNLYQLVERIN